MKDSDSNRLILSDNKEPDLPNIKNLKSSEIEQLDDYVNAPNLKEADIKLLIEQLNNLPYCLNTFLEINIRTQKKIFQLLEIQLLL